MSWRRFAVVLAGLPIESRYMTAVRNDADPSRMPAPTPGIFGPWPQSDMLLARVGDLVEALLWQNAGDPALPKPKPYSRPGVESKVTPISARAAAYMDYLREYRQHPPDDWVRDLQLNT